MLNNRANELEKIIGERDDEKIRVFKLSKREYQITKEIKQEKIYERLYYRTL
jgi:hypothetical protein